MGPEAQVPESEVEIPEKLSVGENLGASISQQTGEEQINLGGAIIKKEAPAPSITKEDTLSVPESEAKVQEAKPKPKPKHKAKHKGKAKPKPKKTLIDEVPIIDGHLPAGLPTAEQLILMINRDFEAIFKLGDKDGDGTLCHSEIEVLLIELLEHRELPLGTKTVAGFMYKVDRDRKGLVCKEEFNNWFRSECLADRSILMNVMGSDEKREWLGELTERAIKMFDMDEDGCLSIEELICFFAEVSKQWGEDSSSREQIEQTLVLYNKKKDGKLGEDELQKLLKEMMANLFFHTDGGRTSASSSRVSPDAVPLLPAAPKMPASPALVSPASPAAMGS